MKISLVVPVFNEEDTIQIFYQTVRSNQYLKQYDVEVIFVNDGSFDKTEEIIHDEVKARPRYLIAEKTGNQG